MADITGVLLAAGCGTRFGVNKLLTQLHGRPLIAHGAAALAPCDHLIAVVRPTDTALQAELRALGITSVVNPEPTRGMGRSIACAVGATADSAGWCILPGDMPHVRAATTQQVVAALRAGAVLAAPFCQGRRGHPVGFSAVFLAQLSALDGDTGARAILEQHIDQLRVLATDDVGVLRDIDRRADLLTQRPA